jgi:hypothetical protein
VSGNRFLSTTRMDVSFPIPRSHNSNLLCLIVMLMCQVEDQFAAINRPLTSPRKYLANYPRTTSEILANYPLVTRSPRRYIVSSLLALSYSQHPATISLYHHVLVRTRDMPFRYLCEGIARPLCPVIPFQRQPTWDHQANHVRQTCERVLAGYICQTSRWMVWGTFACDEGDAETTFVSSLSLSVTA